MRCLPIILTAAALGVMPPGCARKTYDPAWATRPYPEDLHTTKNIADMQVFRDDTTLQVVNTTATSYGQVDLWVNQRFVAHVDSLPAGQTVTLSLWEFKDVYGNMFNAGGLFSYVPATPVRLVQIQTGPEQPLVGLVTIRREDITVPAEPGR